MLAADKDRLVARLKQNALTLRPRTARRSPGTGRAAPSPAAAVDVAREAASDPGTGAVSTGWARRFGAADADVAAARDVILDVVEAAAERRRKAAG